MTNNIERPFKPLSFEQRRVLDVGTLEIWASGLARKYNQALKIAHLQREVISHQVERHTAATGRDNPTSRLLRAIMGPKTFEGIGEAPLAISVGTAEYPLTADTVRIVEIVQVDTVFGQVLGGSEIYVGDVDINGDPKFDATIQVSFSSDDLTEAIRINDIQYSGGYEPRW
jgi:hypothetical protein